MSIDYQLDFEDSQRLEELFRKHGQKVEELSNEYLERTGSKLIIEKIIGFMPVSNRNKVHAKYSNPLKEELYNMGVRIYAKGGAAKNKGSFGYLVFPNEGRGPTNPVAQQFMEKGLDAANKEIIDDLAELLASSLEE